MGIKNANVGVGDIKQMNIQGLSMIDAEKAFSLAVYGQSLQ